MSDHIANIIAQARKKKGMTQKQLADVLHVTDKAVSKWERGSGYPDIRMLEPLARALGVTVGELIGGVAESAEEPRDASSDPADQEETAMKNTLTYAEKVYSARFSNISRAILFIYTLLGFIGILSTSIVDLALNGALTWSLYPISSIVFVWLCAAPPLCAAKGRAVKALGAFSLFVLPYLGVLHWLVGIAGLFSIAFPITLISVAAAWLSYFVYRAGIRWHNKIALWLLITATVDIGVELALVGSSVSDGIQVWDVLPPVLIALAAGVVVIVARMLRRA